MCLYAFGDSPRNVFLNSERFVGGLFIDARPEQAAIPPVNEPSGNAKAIAIGSDAAFHQRIDTEALADTSNIIGFSFEVERRGARHNTEVRIAGQYVD